MRRDFEIKDGIYLSQPPNELDLHNNFDFCGFHYSIEDLKGSVNENVI